jgi:hypothetical protein
MELQQVESSNIAAIGYSQDEQLLYIEFKNGSTYKYAQVEFETYTELMDAESHGKYFQAKIRGHYEFDKIS